MGSRDPYSCAQHSLGFNGHVRRVGGHACSYANLVRRFTRLNTERSIKFQLRCSASEALQRIVEATDRVRLLRQVDGRSCLKRLEILLYDGQFVVKVVALDNLLDAANVR
jgi:hypothetical protein